MSGCDECVSNVVLPAPSVAALRSRDYDLRPVADLAHAEIGAQKPFEPAGWLARVLASVLDEGVLEPILVTPGPQGLELIDGHHRAWAAAQHGISAPALVFTPSCGGCSEVSFSAAAMARTAELGWKY